MAIMLIGRWPNKQISYNMWLIEDSHKVHMMEHSEELQAIQAIQVQQSPVPSSTYDTYASIVQSRMILAFE